MTPRAGKRQSGAGLYISSSLPWRHGQRPIAPLRTHAWPALNSTTVPLAFVLAPATALVADRLPWAALEQLQELGIRGASALRIFAAGRPPRPVPAELPLDGQLGGPDPFASTGFRLICDATIPHFDPTNLCLGVYGPAGDGSDQWQQLDRLPLSEAANETCWFYPTHDGSFLSWQRNLAVLLSPGQIVDPPPDLPGSYDRGLLTVLWSLLADDTSLTCVGLTYDGRRIDWSLGPSTWQPTASWSEFAVNSSAETPLTVLQRWVVEPEGQASSGSA